MQLTLKPAGRGNWAPITMTVDGARAAPLLVKVGDRIPMGGIEFRVCKVSA